MMDIMSRRIRQTTMMLSQFKIITYYSILWISIITTTLTSTTTTNHSFFVTAFTLPTYGIGSLLFPVRNTVFDYVSEINTSSNSGGDGGNSPTKKMVLGEVSDFFVDSFWTGKVGGGSNSLTKQQRNNLYQSQNAEFTKRYGSSSYNRRKNSELIVCRINNNNNNQQSNNNNNNNNNIIGCVGVEIDKIPAGTLSGPIEDLAPLMSNLAISRDYRRRGLAEKLVKSVEILIKRQWGYDTCYLYVEQRNKNAVQLYQKLGYKTIWTDTTAKTLLPTIDGNLVSAPTVLLCMKKTMK